MTILHCPSKGIAVAKQAKVLPIPTLSTLSGRNLIKTADLLSKQTEDVDLHIVETCNEIMHLPLSRHSDAVNAFQQLENPT
jgi:hypothetical protein